MTFDALANLILNAVVIAASAFYGSRDAAKRLHDALLPGWEWTIHQNGAVIVRRDVGCKPYGGPIRNAEAMEAARAWLLAILRALEEGGR